MTPERWKQIEDLYHRAYARPEEDRGAFLSEACGKDEALRREVESLLAQPVSAEGLLERRAVAVAAHMLRDPLSSIVTGRHYGIYHVLSPLGAGGMGEVYRARDTKLGREVAVKILKPSFMNDPERLARFEREARALAALNHPNIGAIYGFDEFDHTPVLVLELVNGETLADRLAPEIARGVGLPTAEALKIAGQIAEALEAAHAKGIIHRDLKPANIKITPEGVVKVLDFGLAKLFQPPSADDSEVVVSPTVTANETREGLIVGTAAYLSPEQARGQAVDKRTDIWAFGCVVYEMLAGRPAFAGNTVSDTIVTILEREPDWRALPPSVPAQIRALLQRCLRKDRRYRLRDIGDAGIEISEATMRQAAGGSPADETFPASPERRAFPWSRASIVAATAGAVIGLAWYVGRQSISDTAPGFARMIRLVSTPAHEFGPAISPDGKWVAYLSNARGPTDVWVKFIAGGEPANLTASAGVVVQSQDYIGGLDVSPDGTLIAFTAGRPGAGTIEMSTWVIPAPLGGVPRKLLNEPHQGLRWSADGKRIAYMRPGGSAGDGVLVADADGQNERELIKPEGGRHIHWLRWSPDGRYVYFNYGIQNFNTEPTQIGRVLAAGGSLEPVVQTARRAVFPFPSPDGLFYAANPDSADLSLWWRDLRSGRDYRVTSGVGEYGVPYLSPDGQRLVGTVVNVRQALERVAVAFDRRVALEPLTDGFTGDLDPSSSPDGGRLVFSSSRGGNRNIWSAQPDLLQPTPITSGENFDERPVYSPDGQQLAFVSDRGGRRGLWVVNVEGGTPRLVTAADVLDTISWSPDGRRLVYAVPLAEAPGLVTVSVADGAVAPLPTPAAAHAPAWSPRGDVIAYLEPRLGLGTRLRFVSPNGQPVYERLPEVPQQIGNGFPAWSPDGTRLAAVGLPGSDTGHIWIIEPDGPVPIRKLIDLPAGDYLRGATWTRDGSALVVGRIRWAGDIILAERSR